MALWKKNALLLLIAAVICIAPLLLLRGVEFSGADVQAADMIKEIAPDHEPWLEPVTEPPGGEAETFLFALQAGIGGCVVGFVVGRLSAGKKAAAGKEHDND